MSHHAQAVAEFTRSTDGRGASCQSSRTDKGRTGQTPLEFRPAARRSRLAALAPGGPPLRPRHSPSPAPCPPQGPGRTPAEQQKTRPPSVTAAGEGERKSNTRKLEDLGTERSSEQPPAAVYRVGRCAAAASGAVTGCGAPKATPALENKRRNEPRRTIRAARGQGARKPRGRTGHGQSAVSAEGGRHGGRLRVRQQGAGTHRRHHTKQLYPAKALGQWG